ncbi:hypothetical protein Q9L58_010149 [Maublancomyces gigas]|uniref:Uncharacterized protein n=1 Tax=Discina gigas TaxID=1032678 RepID=A0ABR3G4W9_9PEZI
MACIRHLLRQPEYKDDMVYAPTVERNTAWERMYGEMNKADCWWETHNTLPEGATVVPIDKKAWPVYITIGNIKAAICNKPSNGAILLLALLPVPPKLEKETFQFKYRCRQSQQAFHPARQDILHSLLTLTKMIRSLTAQMATSVYVSQYSTPGLLIRKSILLCTISKVRRVQNVRFLAMTWVTFENIHHAIIMFTKARSKNMNTREMTLPNHISGD